MVLAPSESGPSKEILTVTKAKVWLWFVGTIAFIDGIEEQRVGKGMAQ